MRLLRDVLFILHQFFTAFNAIFNSQALLMQKKEKGRAENFSYRPLVAENLPPHVSNLLFFLSVS